MFLCKVGTPTYQTTRFHKPEVYTINIHSSKTLRPFWRFGNYAFFGPDVDCLDLDSSCSSRRPQPTAGTLPWNMSQPLPFLRGLPNEVILVHYSMLHAHREFHGGQRNVYILQNLHRLWAPQNLQFDGCQASLPPGVNWAEFEADTSIWLLFTLSLIQSSKISDCPQIVWVQKCHETNLYCALTHVSWYLKSGC